MQFFKHTRGLFLYSLVAAQMIGCGTKTETSNERTVSEGSKAAAATTANADEIKAADAAADSEVDGVKLSTMEVAPIAEASVGAAARPAAPTTVKLTKTGRDVSILWNSVRGAKTYQVVRSINSAARKVIALTPKTPYKDANLPLGTSVVYWIATVAPNGSVSIASPAVTAKIFSAAPTNVTAALTASAIRVQWRASYGATSYAVYYKHSSQTVYTKAGSTTGLSLDINSLNGGAGAYSFYVVSLNAGGSSPKSLMANLTVTAPATPSLDAYYVNSNSTYYSYIQLNWSAVSGALTYQLEWSSPYRGWTYLGTFSGTSYQDNQFPDAGVTYSYRVRAIGRGGIPGYYSNVRSVLVAPAAPRNLSVEFLNYSGNVSIRWQGDGSYGTSYKIYRRDYESSNTYYWIGSSNSESYIDYQVAYGHTYYYAVSAVNSAGESDTSSATYVTIPQYSYNQCDTYYSDYSCSGLNVNAACGNYGNSSCRATSTLDSGLAICSCTNYSSMATRAFDPSARTQSVTRRAP